MTILTINRRWQWGVVLAMVLVAAGCAKITGDSTEEAASRGPRQAVDAMLRQRAKALTDGDVEAYLAPMTAEARAVEEPIARGSSAVPLAEVSWNFYRDFKEYEPSGSMQAHPLEELRADATHRLLRRIYDMDERQLDEKTRDYIKNAVQALPRSGDGR